MASHIFQHILRNTIYLASSLFKEYYSLWQVMIPGPSNEISDLKSSGVRTNANKASLILLSEAPIAMATSLASFLLLKPKNEIRL